MSDGFLAGDSFLSQVVESSQIIVIQFNSPFNLSGLVSVLKKDDEQLKRESLCERE